MKTEESNRKGNGEAASRDSGLPKLRPLGALSDTWLASGMTGRPSVMGLSFPFWMTRSDPPVARPRKGLYKLWMFGAVVQYLSQPHCLVKVVLEIDKRVGSPKSFLQFFARDELARTLHQ